VAESQPPEVGENLSPQIGPKGQPQVVHNESPKVVGNQHPQVVKTLQPEPEDADEGAIVHGLADRSVGFSAYRPFEDEPDGTASKKAFLWFYGSSYASFGVLGDFLGVPHVPLFQS
jgi:hypothetical protein